MDEDQQFCLRWNNHQSTLISTFDTLLENETLVDCTLAAEGQYLRAHKVVLSACSPYFESLLKLHYDKHPVFILNNVKYQELRAMMDYMYRGEVNISQDQLGAILKAAESLQIKGLSDNKRGDKKPRPASPQPPSAPIKSASQTVPKQNIKQLSSTLVSDSPAQSPARVRETSSSPTPRKRKKLRRRSEEDTTPDNHDPHSNTGSTHSQPPMVTIPLPISVTKQPIAEVNLPAIDPALIQPAQQPEMVQPIEIPKEEPTSELILEPKPEYLDEANEDYVEDLTLDDDEEMDDMDQSQAGPSHGGDSSQGFPWHMGGDHTQDEVFMAAQDAATSGQQRDSQDLQCSAYTYAATFNSCVDPKPVMKMPYFKTKVKSLKCDKCPREYKYYAGLWRHKKYECGIEPQFQCPYCIHKANRKDTLDTHIIRKHATLI